MWDDDGDKEGGGRTAGCNACVLYSRGLQSSGGEWRMWVGEKTKWRKGNQAFMFRGASIANKTRQDGIVHAGKEE